VIEFRQVAARHPAAARDSLPAIQDLSLSIASGERVALIGPSGAGKTTVLHLMAASLSPSAGSIKVLSVALQGLSARGLRALRKRLFLAPQTPPLPPRQRVVTAVLAARLPHWSLLRSLRSLFYPLDMPVAHDALAAFELDSKLFDRVDRLSGGERQRVGLSRALVSEADLWLIDEPLSALDPRRAQAALKVLTEQAQARGVGLICSLHQVELALSHFDRIVGLRDGRMSFDLPTQQVTADLLQQLYAQHEHELAGAPTGEALTDPSFDEAQPVAGVPLMHCR
jgi:phosphonate transport system ATP-binding protein